MLYAGNVLIRSQTSARAAGGANTAETANYRCQPRPSSIRSTLVYTVRRSTRKLLCVQGREREGESCSSPLVFNDPHLIAVFLCSSVGKPRPWVSHSHTHRTGPQLSCMCTHRLACFVPHTIASGVKRMRQTIDFTESTTTVVDDTLSASTFADSIMCPSHRPRPSTMMRPAGCCCCCWYCC